MEVKKGRPLAISTVEDLDSRIKDYFERCEETEKPFTMSGLAVWLDVDRRTLANYGNREEYSTSIRRAKSIIEADIEEKMLMGKINTTGAIFSLKNNYKWTDKVEVETTNVNTNSNIDLSNLSKEEIKELLKSES